MKDILYITQELMDKFGNSIKLLNIQAACHIVLQQYDDALLLLQKALEEVTDNIEIG